MKNRIFKKLTFILMLISLSTCLGLMSNTYSRYIADASGSVDVLFSKWQILVNETDITSSAVSTVEFTPIVDSNDNVADGVIAPSSTGYYDIEIDPSNVEVSFDYTITVTADNALMPDIGLTGYAILASDYIEGDPVTVENIVDDTISGTLTFDNETPDFAFDTFTVRVYFEWYEGDGETMDDDTDTALGLEAATTGASITLDASISFEQVIN